MFGSYYHTIGIIEDTDPVFQRWSPSSPSRKFRFVMSTLKYTIVISDQCFTLLRDQIMRDAPNYFTAFFEGSFRETSEGRREMELHRDPYLFKFIHLYLSGYEILPLPTDDLPCYFSEESRLKNLLLDARFYGLDALAEELEAVVSKKGQDGKLEKERWKV